MIEKTYFVYILHCKNGTLYTGYAADLKRRLEEHFLGSAKCKYTRSFKPRGLAQCWQIEGDRALAMRIETFIKKLSRKSKEELILKPELLMPLFSCHPLKKSFRSFIKSLKRDI